MLFVCSSYSTLHVTAVIVIANLVWPSETIHVHNTVPTHKTFSQAFVKLDTFEMSQNALHFLNLHLFYMTLHCVLDRLSGVELHLHSLVSQTYACT